MSNEMLHDMLIEVVENQLRDNDPPETRETLKRLQKAGYDREEAVEMIARAVVSEIYDVLKYKKSFDEERFKGFLDELE